MRKFIYLIACLLLSLFPFEGVQAQTSKTTTGDEAMVVTQQFLYLNVVGDMIRVDEFLVLENRSNTTLVGAAGKRVLSFTLPEGFFAPQFIDELADAVSITDRGFDYIKPVEPGELRVRVSYHLKASALPYTFSIRPSYLTQSVAILTDIDKQVISDQLSSQPPIQQGEKQFRLYTGGNFDKGVAIPVTLSEELQDDQRQGLIVSIIVSMLIAGGIFSVYIKKWLDKNRKASRPSKKPRLSLKQEREDLIRAIAELDDRFETGDVPEEIYHKERARKKKRLIELTWVLSRERGARSKE